MKEQKLYLGGEWRTSEEQTVLFAPASGQAIARLHLATPRAAEEAVRKAKEAFSATRKLTGAQRSAILLRLRDGVLARRAEFERTMVEESGKPILQARQELERGLCTLLLAAEEAKRIGGELIPLDLLDSTPNKVGITRRFPLGTVLGIPAFNFPFNLVAHKIAPALAAGNAVILKPAPQTPLTALLLAEVFGTAGAPEGMLSVLPCRNDVAETLVAHEDIQALTFTGSTRVGWHLKARCGKKRVLLELGGNAGVIVDSDANLDEAAAKCARAAFAYAGQVCVSLQRVFIHSSVYKEFVDRLVACTQGLRVGDPFDEATHVGPMIDEAAAMRAEKLVQDAVAGGARVLTGGRRDRQFFQPTVLAEVTPELKVCREEAFAPVVTVSPFAQFDDAIRLVNATPYGLQAGIFSGRIRNILQAFADIEAGGIIVNDAPMFRADNGPFGGFKDSGIGREAVRETILQMTETKLLVLNA